jgi:hypothetical protein
MPREKKGGNENRVQKVAVLDNLETRWNWILSRPQGLIMR